MSGRCARATEKMFSTLGKTTALARQALRATKHDFNGRWISTSAENKRSDVLTQREQEKKNAKSKLEQQERSRDRRNER